MTDLQKARVEATALSEGWYEFITPVTAMTKIAYVYESGGVYLPDSDKLDWEHATARHKLVRADAVLTVEMIERAIMGYTADVGAKNVLDLIRGGEEQ